MLCIICLIHVLQSNHFFAALVYTDEFLLADAFVTVKISKPKLLIYLKRIFC